MHRKSEMLKENQIQNEEAPRLMNNNVQKEREKKTEKKRHVHGHGARFFNFIFLTQFLIQYVQNQHFKKQNKKQDQMCCHIVPNPSSLYS